MDLPLFSLYSSNTPLLREQKKIRQNMISLLIEGEKIIHIDGRPVITTPESVMLLRDGNYLCTEQFPRNGQIRSIIIAFGNEVLDSFNLAQKNNTERKYAQIAAVQPFALFPKDDYLCSYMTSLQTLLAADISFPSELQLLKLNELLLYLSARHSEIFASIFTVAQLSDDKQKISKIVTENLMNDLSVSELAFLCNMSLPTFKRKFAQFYHTSPAKWIREQKLQIAANLLLHEKARPADVYMAVGYENHSSFSQAFKEYYGIMPKDYGGQPPF